MVEGLVCTGSAPLVCLPLASVLCSVLRRAESSAEPEPLPSVSKSPSPSGSASPSKPAPPTLPAEAKGSSAKSAKAFVRHYVERAEIAAVPNGDTGYAENLGSRQCQSCRSVLARIGQVYDAGGKIASHGWKVTILTVLPSQPRSRPIIDAGISLSPQTVVKRKGAKPVHFGGGRLPATFHLAERRGTWLVMEWSGRDALGKAAVSASLFVLLIASLMPSAEANSGGAGCTNSGSALGDYVAVGADL